MTAFDSLLPLGEGGAQRRMRAWIVSFKTSVLVNHCHSLIRPSGTFSRGEKEKRIAFASEIHP